MSADVTNPLEGQSDAVLVMGAPGAARLSIEMMRRLKDAVQAQTTSADTLGKRIARLNIWLLVFTAAIFGLTVVLVLVELKIIER